MREYHKAERELAEAAFANEGCSVLDAINERISALTENRGKLLESFTAHIEQEHESPRLLHRLGWTT